MPSRAASPCVAAEAVGLLGAGGVFCPHSLGGAAGRGSVILDRGGAPPSIGSAGPSLHGPDRPGGMRLSEPPPFVPLPAPGAPTPGSSMRLWPISTGGLGRCGPHGGDGALSRSSTPRGRPGGGSNGTCAPGGARRPCPGRQPERMRCWASSPHPDPPGCTRMDRHSIAEGPAARAADAAADPPALGGRWPWCHRCEARLTLRRNAAPGVGHCRGHVGVAWRPVLAEPRREAAASPSRGDLASSTPGDRPSPRLAVAWQPVRSGVGCPPSDMCFSPEADLVTGIVVSGVGIDALRHVSSVATCPWPCSL